jgi:hypothetical protein
MVDDNKKSGIEITLEYIQRDIGDIKKRLDDSYVTVQEFEPVKKIVYGLVTLVLTGVLLAMIALVVK